MTKTNLKRSRGTKKPTKIQHIYKAKKAESRLVFSLKYFIIGALVAFVPMYLYAATKLNPNQNYFKLNPVKIVQLNLSGGKPQSAGDRLRIEILAKDYEPGPSATPTATPLPIKPATVKMTASIQVHKISAPAEIQAMIEKYASQYSVNKDIMVQIAKCESGFRESAASGPYAGIYQFIASTWSSNRRAMGLDPNPTLRYNAEEAVKTAAFKMSRDGFGAWPACSRKAIALLGAN